MPVTEGTEVYIRERMSLQGKLQAAMKKMNSERFENVLHPIFKVCLFKGTGENDRFAEGCLAYVPERSELPSRLQLKRDCSKCADFMSIYCMYASVLCCEKLFLRTQIRVRAD